MCGRCCERAERTHINKSCVDATVAFEVKARQGKKIRRGSVLHGFVLE